MSHSNEKMDIKANSNVYTDPVVDIVIPTYDNPKQAEDCIVSIWENSHPQIHRVLLVNNGLPGALRHLHDPRKNIFVIESGSNLGWEGGINSTLDKLKAPLTLMLNDDTFIPPNDPSWLLKMACHFNDPSVGAVGPSSNFVMQKQNMFWLGLPRLMETTLLVGFCMMVRTDLLKDLGGLAKDLPGGDDLDLSARIRARGLKLILDRSVFVFHHGQQTGKRVYGKYWDSQEHQDRTNAELIRRNGFKEFLKTRRAIVKTLIPHRFNRSEEDSEGNHVRKEVEGREVIVEMGCGFKKTVENSIGVDIFPKGEEIPTLREGNKAHYSVADVVSSVDALPFEPGYADVVIARHILEHMTDLVKTLKEWARVLKKGGLLVIAVPDNAIIQGIPLNPEHVHAFTKDSLTNLVESCTDLKLKKIIDPKNGLSLVGVYERS